MLLPSVPKWWRRSTSLTIRSELGELIHKVATRWAVKLWKEFDNTVFRLPKEKRELWLAERKEEIIGKQLCETLVWVEEGWYY